MCGTTAVPSMTVLEYDSCSFLLFFVVSQEIDCILYLNQEYPTLAARRPLALSIIILVALLFIKSYEVRVSLFCF